jgi:HEAT repeat protein
MRDADVWAECTSEELVERALKERDEDTRWKMVVELQRRGSETELELARRLLLGSEAAQVLACDVLGQLGHTRMELGVPPFGSESAALLSGALRSDSPDVQQAAVTAAGHLKWETLVPRLIELARSGDVSVRQAVAFSLGGRADEASVDALIGLSGDADDDVRNWATFGLGTLSDRRDDKVCDALAQRIDDPHDETRGEAWAGLASKGDARAFSAVLESLESDDLWLLAIEAAEFYAHPALLPALERWLPECQQGHDQYLRGKLERAVQACREGALGIV